ncbi:MAG: isoaspartyl peptidase/L-asparaginase, partial [Candidatus Eremiobacterota bacterium]
AVVGAVRLLEDDPLFNAGTGSKLQCDGRARMSASLMDGLARRFSGVINVERVRNPILLAARLQSGPFQVLADSGATEWARAAGFPDYDPVTPERLAAYRSATPGLTGTVGACAVHEGRVAAATSTGGRGMETVGRVSDSATVAGNYADARAAVSCTGVGEEIVDEALAVRLVLHPMPLDRAFEEVFAECQSRGRRFGAVGVDRDGRICLGQTPGLLFWASWQEGRVDSFRAEPE